MHNPKLHEALTQEYAQVMRELEAVEKRKADIGETILKFMREDGEKTIKNKYGMLSRVLRETFEYSKKVGKAELALKQLKEVERKTGKAKVINATEFLRFQ